jgi:fumarate hydratase subunit beta
MRNLTPPLTHEVVAGLCCSEEVLISGTLYTARDAAHRRLCNLIEAGRPLPLDLAGQILYYTGPSPARPGRPIGSAGPTTSGRMDSYTPRLIETTSLAGMIGKGERSEMVVAAIRRFGAVYFTAIGGAGALLSTSISEAQVVCYADLGPEAIYRLTVKDFPVIVAIDSRGCDIFRDGPAAWATIVPPDTSRRDT